MSQKHFWSIAAVLAATPVAAVEIPGATLNHQFGLGLQLTDVSGSEQKFEEYRDVVDGFDIDNLTLGLQQEDSPQFYRLELRDAGQDDEFYSATVGRYGRYRLNVSFNAIPHRFTGGTFVFDKFGTNYLRVPESVRAQLEANQQTAAERSPGATPGSVNPATDPNTDTTGEDAIQQQIVRGLIDGSDRVSFEVQRRIFGAGLDWNFTDALNGWFRVDNENRDGARVISTGTYERWNVGTGLNHTQDRFMVAGQDLAEPIDYRTLRFAGGAGVHRERWLADVEYSFTNFRNFNTDLRWDNPFRITPTQQATGGFNRGLYGTGHLALVPDSQSHEITLSGAVDIPLDGRFAASVGYGMTTQDEDFLPYTLNTGVLVPSAGNAPAATLALPRSDFGGDLRTLSTMASLALRPVHMVSVDAKYRLYRYDNKSPAILFPGYSAFGDSSWRTVKNDQNAPVINDVFDYVRQNADLEVGFHVMRPLTLEVFAGWERWRFYELRLDRTEEYSIGAGFTLRPMRNATLRGSYRYSDRSAENYAQGRTPENAEATGLLNYNWSDRTRHLADVRFQMSPFRMLTGAISARFRDEDYGGETEGGRIVDEFRFGRTALRSAGVALDVTVTPVERISFNANYAHEYRKESMSSASKDDAAKGTATLGFADDYAPPNYWDSTMLEQVDTLGVSITADVVPERVVLGAGYDLSFSSLDVGTRNPNGVQALTLANAIAQEWSDIRNRLHELRGDVGYLFTPNVRAGIRYIFERYDLDDFAWDLLDPYMAGRTPENSTRYIFADATYHGYEAHVGTLYVAGSF